MRLKKIFIFIVLILLSPILNVIASYEEDMFFEANKYYSSEDYIEAIGLYEKLIKEGFVSANLYYNLGNSYFKINENAKAMLNYERAKKLDPTDEDLFANMAFMKAVMDIPQMDEKYRWYEKFYISVRDAFSPLTWYFNSLIIFYLICIFAALAILIVSFRRTSYIILSALAACFILSMLFFTKSNYIQKHIQQGMIIVPKTVLRYSPSYSGAVAAELSQGIKAQILSRDGDWIQLRISRDASGWVESETIDKI